MRVVKQVVSTVTYSISSGAFCTRADEAHLIQPHVEAVFKVPQRPSLSRQAAAAASTR